MRMLLWIMFANYCIDIMCSLIFLSRSDYPRTVEYGSRGDAFNLVVAAAMAIAVWIALR